MEEASTDGTADGKFEVLLIGDSLGSLDGLKVDYTWGAEIWIYDGGVLLEHLVHMKVQI